MGQRSERFAVLVLLALLVHPSTAAACTCGSFFEPTPEACATAKRVFAGSVAGYRWPTVLDMALRSGDVDVELTIDRVWKGRVPAELWSTTGLGGGDCGISPLPGTRFLFCDDEAAGAPPSFGFCDGGSFARADLEAAHGPSRPPASALALVGHSAPRTLVLGLALAVVIGGLARRRQLAVAVACVSVVITLGSLRPYTGADHSGVVRCSIERAEAILSSDASSLAAAVARTPYACTGWGLATFTVHDDCLGFPDGDGGRWWTCRGDDGFTTLLGWDSQR